MPTSLIVDICRHTLLEVLLLAAPILAIAIAVSLIINIVQVLTSLQESTLSTVPRLAAVGAALFLLLPWMVRRLGMFTVALFSDFHPFVR